MRSPAIVVLPSGSCHSVELFLKDSGGQNVKIDGLDSNGFEDIHVFLFYATLEEPEQPFYEVPSFPGNTTFPFSIQFDYYPEEIGVEIRFANGTLLFYRPPRFYSEYSATAVSDLVPMPSEPHEYIFRIHDIYEDGLDADGSVVTGYILGEKSDPIASSDFVSGSSEAWSFTFPSATNSKAARMAVP